MGSHRYAAPVLALVFAGLLLASACAPSPKNKPCSNDSDCAADERHPYCLQSHCAECLSRGSCNGGACDDGVCHITCKDARDCLHGDVCAEGSCAPR